jgi:hypothetical protein
MPDKQTLPERELFVQALRPMSQLDLPRLKRMVVERLQLLAQDAGGGEPPPADAVCRWTGCASSDDSATLA